MPWAVSQQLTRDLVGPGLNWCMRRIKLSQEPNTTGAVVKAYPDRYSESLQGKEEKAKADVVAFPITLSTRQVDLYLRSKAPVAGDFFSSCAGAVLKAL